MDIVALERKGWADFNGIENMVKLCINPPGLFKAFKSITQRIIFTIQILKHLTIEIPIWTTIHHTYHNFNIFGDG